MLEKLKQFDFKDHLKRENLSVLLIGIVAFWLAWQTVGVVLKNNQLQADIALKREEVSILELNNQATKLEVEYYKTDEFLERSAKRNLLLKRPEENVTVAPLTRNAPFPANQNQSSTVVVNKDDTRSNFQKWVDFLRGYNSKD